VGQTLWEGPPLRPQRSEPPRPAANKGLDREVAREGVLLQ
jgi:hypothetical protein